MNKAVCLLFAVLSAFVAAGENLLLNPMLEADQVDVPTFWRSSNIEGATPIVTCRSSGGPSGVPSVCFYNPPGKKVVNAELRQYDLTLVPGAKYRLSAWIRTKNLRAQRFGILAINARWKNSGGVDKYERDSNWHKVEAEIDMFDSADGLLSEDVFCRHTRQVPCVLSGCRVRDGAHPWQLQPDAAHLRRPPSGGGHEVLPRPSAQLPGE